MIPAPGGAFPPRVGRAVVKSTRGLVVGVEYVGFEVGAVVVGFKLGLFVVVVVGVAVVVAQKIIFC